MDLERLKCKECGKFPDGEIFECAAKEHIVCVECAEKCKKVRCACGAKLLIKKLRNPIEQLVQNVKTICRYEENGCTWKFTASEMEAHVLECKFRPYRCVASSLNVLRCDWIGLQHEIETHLVKCHGELGPVFRFAESSSMVFKESVSIGGLKVVDAFSKHFLFHFFSDAAKRTLSFLMVYFGRREESDQYFYELQLRALPMTPDKPSDTAGSSEGAPPEPPVGGVVQSVKFVERCYSDSENLTELLEDERCIVLTHRQVRKYLHNGKIYFSYKVRKVDGSGRERQHSEPSAPSAAVAAPVVKTKPRPPPFKFVEKGRAPANTKRSTSTSSTASSTSSSTTSGKSSSSSGSGSSEKGCAAAVAMAASRSPSSASTVLMSSERGSAVSGAGTLERSLSSCSSLSSINRNPGNLTPFEKPTHCPLLTPSINKLDLPPSWTTAQTTATSFTYQQQTVEYRRMNVQDSLHGKRYPPAECTTTAAVCKEYTQPYKAQDDRPYLMKHPTNCLYKPKPKW